MVGREDVVALLDGGSVFSLMVELLNAAISSGMTAQSEDWPVAGLQWWGPDQTASTMSQGPALALRAVILLRITIVGLKGEQHRMVTRVRVARSGSIVKWRGVILGAPFLDAPPLGLGHIPKVGGHFFQALGFLAKRLEEKAIQDGLEGLMVAACHHADVLPTIAEVSVPAPATGLPLYLLDVEHSDAISDTVSGRLVAAVGPDAAPVHLDDDDVVLHLGEVAWVPATTTLSRPPTTGEEVEIETNSAASVHAVAGIWDSREGMMVVCNLSQPEVRLSRGDLVGSARLSCPPAAETPSGPADVAVSPAEEAAPAINHVQRKEEELRKLHEVDIPPERYYQKLEAWRRKRFPKADASVLEHCAALEPFLDICIASGFSLGGSKSTGKIFQPEMEFLGDIVGRHGLRSTENHLDAVKHFGPINDAPAMRRFLGAFGWVRKSFPKECIVVLPELTAQLRKDALWPMPPAAEKAKLALQSLALRAILLSVVDEVAAITRERPLEQIADGCRYGWGGTVYQLSPCRRFLNVIGMYSGLLTPAQAQAHPRRVEVLAQRETRRAARKHIGRLPADCWTDHAHLITDLKSPEADSSAS